MFNLFQGLLAQHSFVLDDSRLCLMFRTTTDFHQNSEKLVQTRKLRKITNAFFLTNFKKFSAYYLIKNCDQSFNKNN